MLTKNKSAILNLMSKQKGFAPILIIILIAFFAIGGYFLYQRQNASQSISQPSPTLDKTSNLKTFSRDDVNLQYPANWATWDSGISEVTFTPGEQDRSKTYNIVEIQKYSTQLYSGYTNAEWFNKINGLTEPLSDQRETRTKIISGNIVSSEPYVIFKDEPSATAQSGNSKQVKAYILKDETIYQLTLDLYDSNGLEIFKQIISTAEITK